MKNYTTLFESIKVRDPESEQYYVPFTVVQENPGEVLLAYSLRQYGEVYTDQVSLTVPILTPVRYPWDDGIYGYRVQMPSGALGRLGVRRFAHPLLVSNTANWIAMTRDRMEFATTPNFGFGWWDIYCRIHSVVSEAVQKLVTGQRRVSPRLLWSALHRAIRDMVMRLPVSDEAQELRHMFEIELGYPDIAADNWLYEQVKLRFIEHADTFCDVLCTGKNDVGRFVMRVKADAPKSHVTGQPMPLLSMAVNPLAAWGIPIRHQRENRAIVDCHNFADPIVPPLTIPGVRLPDPLVPKITTVNCLFADILGQNVFEADDTIVEEFGVEPGQELCLDAILVTPSGRRKLMVIADRSELLDAEEFLARKEELAELPGFQVEEIPDLIETMLDGTPIFGFQYRYRYTVPIPCWRDKLKACVGGLKAVTRPIRQLYARVESELQEVDIVIAESALLSKAGIRDAATYALAAMAGLTHINPTESFNLLLDRIEAGLAMQDLPESGQFEIVRREKVPISRGSEVDRETATLLAEWGVELGHKLIDRSIGHGIFGPIPVMRTQETEHRQSSAARGMSVNIQARILGQVPTHYDGAVARQVEDYAQFAYTATDAVTACLDS